jgi:hypothetical protein
MTVTTYEGVVEKGKIRLKVGVHLPEKAKVFVIIPDVGLEKNGRVLTPRLKNLAQTNDFEMEVSEDVPDASL